MAAAVIARGAVSALGSGVQAFDVGGPNEPAPSAWSTRQGGKPFARVTSSQASRADRPRRLLELALAQVITELDALDAGWRARRLGVAVGTSSGGLPALERAAWSQSAYFAPLAGVASMLGREPDRLVSLYGACASSALALGLALRWLALGQCELVIAGGYDAESDWVSAGFDSLKATSAQTPRSFRAERDGMALGEGAALLALVSRATRGHGFVRGFGASSDAVHITAPDRTGQGLARAAELALADAGVTAEDVDFVSVHGTGTSFNDASEAAALTRLFGSGAVERPLHAFKPSLGHTLGAAGALETLAALTALERGLLPASAGHGSPMLELPAPLLARNQPAPVNHCLKLATAFGGANAALLLSRSDDSSAWQRQPLPVHCAATGQVVCQLEVERVSPLLVAPVERLPRSDVLSELSVAASAEALRAAAARGVLIDRARTGVVVGSTGLSLEAVAAFAQRLVARGPDHAEPRRFPATSPNACAGHVAIAFGLHGPSHAVGSGPRAANEALEVACDWIAAGDADAMLVVAAEQVGETSQRALGSAGTGLEQGAYALLLCRAASGPRVEETLLRLTQVGASGSENRGFRWLEAVGRAAGLPGSGGFGSVRAPE